MATCCYPDIFTWLQSLPVIKLWKTNSIFICICSSTSSQPSLNLSVAKNPQSQTVTFSIVANYNLPISLWVSKPININPKSLKLLDDQAVSTLLTNFIEDVLSYCSNKCTSSIIRVPKLEPTSNFKDIFNVSFLTLTFLICIYEAPADLRCECLANLKNQLTNCQLRQAKKLLMKSIGSNLEEQWMRSISLAITNWIEEVQGTQHRSLKTPSPMFSYSFSTLGLWKIQLYCPVIAMDIESSSHPLADERLAFSLKYHQLEGVIQFIHNIIIQDKWVDVILNIDNIRCDVVRLVNEALMTERGVGIDEKYFPSRISLHLTPILQNDIISVSVNKSSENPTIGMEQERNIETSFDPPNTFLGLKLAIGETTSMNMKPWKFEESVYGYSAILNWFLHDSTDGREVVSSKPSKMALINPKAWFKDRYSSAYRPFTRQGGVIFAGDEYGKSVRWKVGKNAMGKTMEWEIKGWIWLTYWPNKHRTFYSETRRLEFRENLHLTIV